MNTSKNLCAIMMLLLLCGHIAAQRSSQAVSKPFKLKVENRLDILHQLQEDNKRFQSLWEQELAMKRAALSEAQKVSDAIQIEAKPTVALGKAEDGGQDMNLNVNFAYSTIAPKDKGVKFNVSSKTDDYPSGAYKPAQSNACRLTLDFVKNKMETELAKYLTPGAQVNVVNLRILQQMYRQKTSVYQVVKQSVSIIISKGIFLKLTTLGSALFLSAAGNRYSGNGLLNVGSAYVLAKNKPLACARQ